MILRIATRRSKLALAQSEWVKTQLEAAHPGLTVELREYVTRGDRIQNVPLQQVGGKGLFTKEIEDALLAGEADLAVHSLKDLPSELPPGLLLATIPPREDPCDALVLGAVDDSPRRHRDTEWDSSQQSAVSSQRGTRTTSPPHHLTISPGAEGSPLHAPRSTLHDLPAGAKVGSSSLRRSAQILYARRDLHVESVRGNVDTRLRKLDEGRYDALVLAAAGLNRLGLSGRISALLPVEISTPAPGQGALGLECREDDARTRELLAPLDDPDTRTCVAAERALMTALGGGCSVPLGALAEIRDGELRLTAVVARPDGSWLLRKEASRPATSAEELGRAVAAMLVEDGARSVLGA